MFLSDLFCHDLLFHAASIQHRRNRCCFSTTFYGPEFDPLSKLIHQGTPYSDDILGAMDSSSVPYWRERWSWRWRKWMRRRCSWRWWWKKWRWRWRRGRAARSRWRCRDETKDIFRMTSHKHQLLVSMKFLKQTRQKLKMTDVRTLPHFRQ